MEDRDSAQPLAIFNRRIAANGCACCYIRRNAGLGCSDCAIADRQMSGDAYLPGEYHVAANMRRASKPYL